MGRKGTKKKVWWEWLGGGFRSPDLFSLSLCFSLSLSFSFSLSITMGKRSFENPPFSVYILLYLSNSRFSFRNRSLVLMGDEKKNDAAKKFCW